MTMASSSSNLRQRRQPPPPSCGGDNNDDGGNVGKQSGSTTSEAKASTTAAFVTNDEYDEFSSSSVDAAGTTASTVSAADVTTVSSSSRYILIGKGSDWTAKNGIEMKLLNRDKNRSSSDDNDDDDNIRIYGCSFQTTVALERVLICDGMGVEVIYYPQGGGAGGFGYRSHHVTKVLHCQPYKGCFDMCWAIGEGKPNGCLGDDFSSSVSSIHSNIGTRINVYFLPDHRLFLWDIPDPDATDVLITTVEDVIKLITKKYNFTNFYDIAKAQKKNRRRKSILITSLSPDDVWATTQFKIDPDDRLSTMILMSTDRSARIRMGFFYSIPHIIMAVLLAWVYYSAPKLMTVKLYWNESISEWLCVIAIYFSIFMKDGFDLKSDVLAVHEYYKLAKKVVNTEKRSSMKIAATFAMINVMQIPLSFALSMFIAVYLSEGVFLNVLLNVVALEFVTEIDHAMVGSYIRRRFGPSVVISFSILDIRYADGFDEGIDLWYRSCTSFHRALELLSSSDNLTNEMKWELLTSTERGLGILGCTKHFKEQQLSLGNDVEECVTNIRVHLGVVDWELMSEDDIRNYGKLYLKSTSNETWEHYIGYDTRGLLFEHYPELTVQFPWYGMNLEGCNLQDHHATYISNICNIHKSNVESVSVGSSLGSDLDILQKATIGEGVNPTNFVRLLCQGLSTNTTLKALSLSACDLNDDCVKILADFLRTNSSVEHMWLVFNTGITDVGALALLSAISDDDDDYNSTITSIVFGGNCISPKCEERCNNEVNNRMIFLSEKYPNIHSYFLRDVDMGEIENIRRMNRNKSK